MYAINFQPQIKVNKYVRTELRKITEYDDNNPNT